MMIFKVVLALLIGFCLGAPQKTSKTKKHLSNPWEEFQYAVELDVAGKYWMFWTPDDDTQTITFEVHVEALGYVGFGISPNGGMTGADVVIGWVNDADGTAVFHDRHALGEFEPVIDDSQDVTLLSATQNDTHTILRFSRIYVTCDENDRDVTADTTRIIYSFTNTDPENVTGLDYHGATNRGSKSVVLLNYNDDDQSLPDDAISIDFVVAEHTVPRKRTTYWCEFVQVPQLDQKHHVVMFEPIITAGNEGVVHHIVLYRCVGEIDDNNGEAWDCIRHIMPDQYACVEVIGVWAVGGNAFFFPEHTGMPFFASSEETNVHLRLEMHYDNPTHVDGIRDSSGIRLHMTPTLREHDIGVLAVGAEVHYGMMIPPHFPNLNYRGHCIPECLQKGFNTTDGDTENDQMNVFAVYQHAHLLGRKMKTRIFRDDAELEPLLNDDNYDFNFQETRKLKEERIIQPSDLLVVDCGYQSTDKVRVTHGGLATKDEMCVSFLYYYPAKSVIGCYTVPPLVQSIRVIEGLEIEPVMEWPYFRIAAPPEFENMDPVEAFASLDWTNSTVQERYQDLILEENVPSRLTCISDEGGLIVKRRNLSPELGTEWIDPDDGQCDETTTTVTEQEPKKAKN